MKKYQYGVLSIVIRNCVQYFKKAKIWGLLEQLVAVVRALLLIVGIIATQDLFEAVIDGQGTNESNILSCLITLGIILVGQHLTDGIGRYLLSKVSYSNMGIFMTEFQVKLGRLPAEFFEDSSFLNQVERAKKCLLYESLGHFASICLQFFSYYLVLFVLLAYYLFQLSPILPIIIVIAFIPAMLGQFAQVKKIEKLEQENAPLRRENDYYKKTIVDRRYCKESRLLGGFNYFNKLYLSTLHCFTKKTWVIERKMAISKFLLSLVSFIGLGISILILFKSTMDGDISIGAFAAVFTALSQIFSIMEEIVVNCLSKGSTTLAQVRNYYQVLDLDEVSGIFEIPDYSKGIVVDNIGFTYPGATNPALSNVSFVIKQGESIAIVGENGSGKSTLVRVMISLYQSNSGNVLIGGLDTKKTHPKALHHRITGIFQNYQHYKMTLEENVCISETKSEMNTERVNKALQEANFHSESAHLKTMLSPEFDGLDLSGGQWQRLAIARGLYRSHDFIILDEPTASIDPVEEALLYQCFKKIVKNKCSVLVTHRLGSVKIADRIIVMDNGKITEIGTHEELLAQAGLYSKMWEAQVKWYD